MFYTARENIKMGDIVSKVWKRFCRRARANDSYILGVSMSDTKKGRLTFIKGIDIVD